MKSLLLAILLVADIACYGQYTAKNHGISDDFLLRIYEGENYEAGIPCGYIAQNGDTIIPLDRYRYCFTDTFRTFAVVTPAGKQTALAIAIDRNENTLYGVYWFDNGPDWPEDGLFRITKKGKIGYANSNGKIVIKPMFECAGQFKDGKARVAYRCVLQKVAGDLEHTEMLSDSWFYIDKKGKKVDP